MNNQKGFIPIIFIVIIGAVVATSATFGVVKYKDKITANVSNVFSSEIEIPKIKLAGLDKAVEELELVEESIIEEKSEIEEKQDNVQKLQNQLRIANQERLEAEKQLIEERAEAKKAKLVAEAEKIKLEAEKLKKAIEESKKLTEETKKEVQTQKEESREPPIIIPLTQESEPIKHELQKSQNAILESEFIEDEIFDSSPENIEVKIEPEFIVADGKSTSTITAIVKNKDGLPISNQLVIFEFVDRLSQRINTDENGVAMLVYTSDGVKGFKNIGIIADSISKVVQINEIDELDPISPTIAKLKSYKITCLGVYYIEREPYDYEESPVYDYEVSFLIDTNVSGNVRLEPTIFGGNCGLSWGCHISQSQMNIYKMFSLKNLNVSNINTEKYIVFRSHNAPIEAVSFRIIIADIKGTVHIDEIYPETITILSKPPEGYEDERLDNCIKHRDGYQFAELGNCLKNIR